MLKLSSLLSPRAATLAGLATAALLNTVAPAQAAVVVAEFDPAYGPAIPNLGFKGSASFFVNDACLALTGLVSNFASCSGNTMSVISAQVDFYNLATPATNIASINYGAGAFSVFDAFISGGVVTGIDTDISQAAPVTLSQIGPNPIDFSGFMSLAFFTGLSELRSPSSSLAANAANPVTGLGGASLYANCVSFGNFNCGQFGSVSNAASVTYATNVPEPSGLALVLLALGVGALATHRKTGTH